jgi:SAM-dependent methyltransferase
MPLPDLRTNYAGHEKAYRSLREQPERPGWDTFEGLARDLALLEDVLGWPGVPRRGDLLEIGCGAGNVALHLAWKGWRVRGIDISPTAIAWARDNARSEGLHVHFAVGDVLTLDGEKDASQDLVLDGHCLHCIIGADRARVLASVQRVLRPGGAFLLRTMCNEPPPSMAQRNGFDPATRCMVRDGVASRYIGRATDLLAELEAAGFRLLQWQVVPARDEADCDELFALAGKQG